MPAAVLDIEQHLLLLELEPPFDKRAVQLARRRMAKRWHPDVAPPGRQLRARAPPEGDQRGRRPARAPRRGLTRRPGVPQRRQGERGGRAQATRGGGRSARLRGRAAGAEHGRRRTRRTRPLRQPRARPLGRPPLRPLPLLSGVGRGHGRRHLLHRRPEGTRGGPAVGARALQPRHPHGPGREHALRRLLQARPRRGARRALHGRRPSARWPTATTRSPPSG